MSKLIPDYVFDSIYDITPEVLTAHGVRGGMPSEAAFVVSRPVHTRIRFFV